jgi:hypothetical protein
MGDTALTTPTLDWEADGEYYKEHEQG